MSTRKSRSVLVRFDFAESTCYLSIGNALQSHGGVGASVAVLVVDVFAQGGYSFGGGWADLGQRECGVVADPALGISQATTQGGYGIGGDRTDIA